LTRLQIPIPEPPRLENGLRGGDLRRMRPLPGGDDRGVLLKLDSGWKPQGRQRVRALIRAHDVFQGSENAAKMQHIKLINSERGRAERLDDVRRDETTTKRCRRMRWSACYGWRRTACAR